MHTIPVISMLRFALVAPLFLFASCDVFFGVVRSAEPGADFDATVAQTIVREHPDCSPAEAYPWDGEQMWCAVDRGEVHARVAYRARGPVTIESLWTGQPPAQAVIDQSLLLQAELIRMLRARFPSLPAEAQWSVEWVRMNDPRGAPAEGAAAR